MCLHLIKSATSLRFHKYRTGKVSACCGAVLSYDNGLSSSATLVSFWTVVGPTPVAFRSECSSTWSVLTGCSVVIRQQEPTSGIGLGAACSQVKMMATPSCLQWPCVVIIEGLASLRVSASVPIDRVRYARLPSHCGRARANRRAMATSRKTGNCSVLSYGAEVYPLDWAHAKRAGTSRTWSWRANVASMHIIGVGIRGMLQHSQEGMSLRQLSR